MPAKERSDGANRERRPCDATIVDWGMIMAAGVMITAPAVVFFAAVQRYLVQGWAAGGVKG